MNPILAFGLGILALAVAELLALVPVLIVRMRLAPRRAAPGPVPKIPLLKAYKLLTAKDFDRFCGELDSLGFKCGTNLSTIHTVPPWPAIILVDDDGAQYDLYVREPGEPPWMHPVPELVVYGAPCPPTR